MDRRFTGRDLTVVIPAHNSADYLQDAIASVEAQTVKPARLIVVENGSTDNSRELLESLRPSCSVDFTVVHTDCPGVSNARNLGFSLARTPLVAMLDADDMYRPGFLACGLEAFNAIDGLVLFFGNRMPLRDGNVENAPFLEQTRLREVAYRERDSGIREVTGDIFTPLLYGNFISPSAAMVSRRAAYKAGLFPNFLDSSEDRLFFSQMVRQGGVAYTLQPVSLYRLHEMSKTSSSDLLHLRRNAVLCLKYLVLELSREVLPQAQVQGVRLALQRAAGQLFYAAADRGSYEYARTRAWARQVGVGNPRPLWFQLKALKNQRFFSVPLRRMR